MAQGWLTAPTGAGIGKFVPCRRKYGTGRELARLPGV
jgi:hypothetical protein